MASTTQDDQDGPSLESRLLMALSSGESSVNYLARRCGASEVDTFVCLGRLLTQGRVVHNVRTDLWRRLGAA